jgi:hypothetical protein
MGYEFSSIEKKVTCFFLHSLHPNRHRLWVFWSIEKRGLHLFSSIHKTDYGTFHPWTRIVMTSLLNLPIMNFDVPNVFSLVLSMVITMNTIA